MTYTEELELFRPLALVYVKYRCHLMYRATCLIKVNLMVVLYSTTFPTSDVLTYLLFF